LLGEKNSKRSLSYDHLEAGQKEQRTFKKKKTAYETGPEETHLMKEKGKNREPDRC